MKFAKLQEEEICSQIAEQYTLDKVCKNLKDLSENRAKLITSNGGQSDEMFKAYQMELMAVYKLNKAAED